MQICKICKKNVPYSGKGRPKTTHDKCKPVHRVNGERTLLCKRCGLPVVTTSVTGRAKEYHPKCKKLVKNEKAEDNRKYHPTLTSEQREAIRYLISVEQKRRYKIDNSIFKQMG